MRVVLTCPIARPVALSNARRLRWWEGLARAKAQTTLLPNVEATL